MVDCSVWVVAQRAPKSEAWEQQGEEGSTDVEEDPLQVGRGGLPCSGLHKQEPPGITQVGAPRPQVQGRAVPWGSEALWHLQEKHFEVDFFLFREEGRGESRVGEHF